MALIVNGVEIPTSEPIIVDGQEIEKVVCNGVTVWEKLMHMYLGVSFDYSGVNNSYLCYSLDGVTFTKNTTVATSGTVPDTITSDRPYVFNGHYVFKKQVETDSGSTHEWYYTKDGVNALPLADIVPANTKKVIYANGKYYAIVSFTTSSSSSYGSSWSYPNVVQIYYKNSLNDSAWTLIGSQTNPVTGGGSSNSNGGGGGSYHFQDALISGSKLFILWGYYYTYSGVSGSGCYAYFKVSQHDLETGGLTRVIGTNISVTRSSVPQVSFALCANDTYLTLFMNGSGCLFYVNTNNNNTTFLHISTNYSVCSNVISVGEHLLNFRNNTLHRYTMYGSAFDSTVNSYMMLDDNGYTSYLSEANGRVYYAGGSTARALNPINAYGYVEYPYNATSLVHDSSLNYPVAGVLYI